MAQQGDVVVGEAAGAAAAAADGPLPVAAQRYRDRVVIVTGGSKGIGEGCVRVFVRHGSKVVFCSRKDSEGKALEEEVNRLGPGESLFVKADVSNEDDIKKLIETTVSKYGKIDCLINNAGQHPSRHPIDEFSADDFKRLFETNVLSYFLAAKYALPYLRKTQGNIINMSSLVSKIGQQGAVTYVTTKGAIDAMTRALAIDEACYSVRVNCVSPGNVWTPMWESAVKEAGTPEGEKATIEGGNNAQLIGRMGTIEESGMTCLWLAADATFCTGSDVPLTGGAELDYGNKNRLLQRASLYH